MASQGSDVKAGFPLDRGISEPTWPAPRSRRYAKELPNVGHGVHGPEIVDHRALAVGGESLADGAARCPEASLLPSPAGNASMPLRKLSVLMPIYNERWTLRQVVSRVLASPVELEIELVAVDDGSTDGSRELLMQLAAADERIKVVLHPANRGKGSAIRTAIEHMTGDVAVIQDADLEYDPAEFPLLLAPILAGEADAVFGSRFVGQSRRVLNFWHSLVNRGLTLVSNVLNGLNLTDMETCYKMVRADVLQHLRLQSRTFTLEPELTCRLAQWGARIFEVPVSYRGRSFQEGKKIRPIDGLKALGEMLRCRLIDRRFTDDRDYYQQRTSASSPQHGRLLRRIEPYLGRRMLHAGCGIGGFSRFLLRCERLVLVDADEARVAACRRRLAHYEHVRVEHAPLGDLRTCDRWDHERLDTVVYSGAAGHLLDSAGVEVLRGFHRALAPGGHCIVVAPAGGEREGGGGAKDELAARLATAGFEIVHAQPDRLNRRTASVIVVGRNKAFPQMRHAAA